MIFSIRYTKESSSENQYKFLIFLSVTYRLLPSKIRICEVYHMTLNIRPLPLKDPQK